MEYAAIRHFADKNYCFALEKGRFLIRLEVKKGDAARVVLHTQDKYLPLRLADMPMPWRRRIRTVTAIIMKLKWRST